MKGVYGYYDKKNDYYSYIDIDSNIDDYNNRNYQHNLKSGYKEQKINQVLQNNPNRYEYRVLIKGNYNRTQLNKIERLLIKVLKTFRYDYPERNVFNFTKGGDGGVKNKYAKIVKSGFTHEGNQNYAIYYNKKTIKQSISTSYLEEWFCKNYPNEKLINDFGKKGQRYFKDVSDDKNPKKGQRYFEDVSDDKNPNYRHDVPRGELLYNEWQTGITQKALSEKYMCSTSLIERIIKKYRESTT